MKAIREEAYRKDAPAPRSSTPIPTGNGQLHTGNLNPFIAHEPGRQGMLADQPHTDASTNQSIHWPSGIAKTFREGAQGIAADVVAAGVGGAVGGGTFAAVIGGIRCRIP